MRRTALVVLISLTLATAAEAAQTGATIDRNFAGVVESIRNLEDGVRRLEMDLSEDSDLENYYQQINKLSEDVGFAADAAEAGRYDEAGKRLAVVVESLARALVPPTTQRAHITEEVRS